MNGTRKTEYWKFTFEYEYLELMITTAIQGNAGIILDQYLLNATHIGAVATTKYVIFAGMAL
jgi:hypothetical protein